MRPQCSATISRPLSVCRQARTCCVGAMLYRGVTIGISCRSNSSASSSGGACMRYRPHIGLPAYVYKYTLMAMNIYKVDSHNAELNEVAREPVCFEAKQLAWLGSILSVCRKNAVRVGRIKLREPAIATDPSSHRLRLLAL